MRLLSLVFGIFIVTSSLNLQTENPTQMPTDCQMCRNLKCVIECLGLD